MNLADALTLKQLLHEQIDTLTEEIEHVAFISLQANESIPTIQSRSLQDIEMELEHIRLDLRQLDRLIQEANVQAVVETHDGPLPLVEAIELAVQLRVQARLYEKLSLRPKKDYVHGVAVIKHALYDPELYRLKARDIKKRAIRIESAIQTVRYQTDIEFDASRYM